MGLKWKNTSFPAPTIKVWENLSTNGGIQYLTDTNVARQFLNLRHPGQVAWTETYLIPTNFWKDMRISATNSTGYLLFEGCSPGKGQLVLTINKPDGTEIAEAASVWLDLEEVSSMYEQAIITDNTIGAISDWTSTLTVKNPLPARPGEDQNIIVMVHGIYVTLLDWDVESDTVFKRLFWSGYQGKFCHGEMAVRDHKHLDIAVHRYILFQSKRAQGLQSRRGDENLHGPVAHPVF